MGLTIRHIANFSNHSSHPVIPMKLVPFSPFHIPQRFCIGITVF